MRFHIDLNRVLGSGAFATVFFGYLDEDDDGQSASKRTRTGVRATSATVISEDGSNSGSREVAVKRIQVDHLNKKDREGNALKLLNHPNVVKLLHAESDQTFR